MSGNPFLDRTFEIRWSQLKPELVEPAIREAISRAQSAIDRIAALDLGAVAFENTFLALENSTEELSLAWAKVSHLQSVVDSPALREAHNAVLPEVSAFFAGIPLNAELWKRLRAFADTPIAAEITGVRKRFIEETVADFKQAGADLPADKRKRLEELQTELAQITQKYSENVLDSTSSWQLILDDEARLKGIPERAKTAARHSAEQKSYCDAARPAWRFTLQAPSMEPVMNYAEDGELRRIVWNAATNVGSIAPFDNSELIPKILALRAEKAALLGFSHFADQVLARRMAKNGAHALEFIEDLKRRAQPYFHKEIAALETFQAEQTGTAPAVLKAWELRFWAERLRKQNFAFDEEELRPYFPMDRVVSGMFEIARRVYGLTVTERPGGSVEVWHPEVRFYDMLDEAGRHVGSFYADWHPRESKRSGAWMNYLITGGPKSDGSRAPHLGLICGNLTPSVDGHPALLTHREVETIFHEFGHLLHHLLGEVEIKSLNGVNVAWDFVELPSQFMENWCWERESLDLFARHHETGAAIPEDLYAKLVAARNFRSGSAAMHQVQLATMDLLLHLRTAEFGSGDIESKMRAAIADTMTPSDPPARTMMRRFTHIFGDAVGYAAGYYSYKWAEVLDADAFTRFKKEGLFNRKTGAEFVEHILSRGNAEDPAVLFRRFMGREPDPQALLIRAGLTG
ncbi:MAG: M3 family metallopeptidase [Opitutaceae bacterium]|jgi:oligopeptidase A